MLKATQAILALSVLALSSCSLFTSKSTQESDINDVVVETQQVAESKQKPIKKVIEESKPEQKPQIAEEAILPHNEVDTRVPIGPFTAEQSASVVIPEFKSQLLRSDLEVKLPELKDEFHYPVDGELSSPYGWRHGRMHTGVDLRSPRGKNIYAAFDGVVRFAKYNGAYGNCIVIRHYNGLETMYAHALKLLVDVNQEVKAGDVIALVGRTGRATGDHLHFEVRVAGRVIDPKRVLDIENRSIVDENLYITMRDGRVFASNDKKEEEREEQIKEALSAKYHIVRSGDTLSRIAANNRTTVAMLCKMNNISSTSILNIGQRVRVQ